LELDLVTELDEARDQMLDPELDGAAVKVVGAEVMVNGAVLEHVIDRRQDRGGHSADCLLRPTSVAELMELGPVTGFGPILSALEQRTLLALNHLSDRRALQHVVLEGCCSS
jgi:hypothetical protein